MRFRRPTLAIVITCAGLVGCTKRDIIASQLGTPATRNADLEASMQIMDEHPEYLADVYAAAKRHPKTLAAMLDLAIADLNDPAMAKLVTAQVAAHPEVIERLVREAIDATSKNALSRAAIDKAIGERADTTVEITADEPVVLAAIVKAAVRVIEKRPAAREAVLRALADAAPEVVPMAMKDPAALKALVAAAVGEATANHAAMKDVLHALGCP